MAIVTIDSPLGPDAFTALRVMPAIEQVQQVKL
jgi:hypothetical protein